MATFDVTDQCHLIPCPVLVIHGTDNQVIPIEQGRALLQLVPRAQLMEMPGMGHWLWAMARDNLVQAVQSFMNVKQRL